VRITSERVASGKEGMPGMPPTEQTMPKKYNAATTLSVGMDADKEENFALTTR